MLWAMRFKLEHQAMIDRINTLEKQCATMREERAQSHTNISQTNPTRRLRRLHRFHNYVLRLITIRTDTQAASTGSTAENSKVALEETVGPPPERHQQLSQRISRSRASHPRQESNGVDDGTDEAISEG